MAAVDGGFTREQGWGRIWGRRFFPHRRSDARLPAGSHAESQPLPPGYTQYRRYPSVEVLRYNGRRLPLCTLTVL